MKTWLLPLHYERRYARFLKKTVAELRKELLQRLGDIIRLQTRAANNVGAESDSVSIAIEEVFEWWRAKREENRRTYAGYFSIVNLFNDSQFTNVVASLTGISLPSTRSAPFSSDRYYSSTPDMLAVLGDDADIYREETYLESIRGNWIDTQDIYMDTVVSQTVNETELLVRKAVVVSTISKVIRDTINAKLDKTAQRVEQGAKDQINTLDAVLTRERQRSIGANEYVWETRRDERVRGNPNGLYPTAKPSHYAREGQVFKWNKPPEGGHPGEAWGCRCRAVLRLPRLK
jgi:hypothetical protein